MQLALPVVGTGDRSLTLSSPVELCRDPNSSGENGKAPRVFAVRAAAPHCVPGEQHPMSHRLGRCL